MITRSAVTILRHSVAARSRVAEVVTALDGAARNERRRPSLRAGFLQQRFNSAASDKTDSDRRNGGDGLSSQRHNIQHPSPTTRVRCSGQVTSDPRDKSELQRNERYPQPGPERDVETRE